MSWVKIVHLTCNACYDWFWDERYTSVRQARKAAKDGGWVCIEGKDYCSKCKPNKHIHVDPLVHWRDYLGVR